MLNPPDVALFSCVYWRRQGIGGADAARRIASQCDHLGDREGHDAWRLVAAQVEEIAAHRNGADHGCPARLGCTDVCRLRD